MASFIIDTSETTAQTLNNGEGGIIGANGSLQVFNTAITMNGNADLLVHGAVGSFSTAIAAGETTQFELIIGPNGSILSGGTGIVADVTDSSFMVNNGTISATGTALQLTADNAAVSFVTHDLVNTGTITSTATALLLESANSAVTEITNTGLISGTTSGINNSATLDGITVINNSGTITGGEPFSGSPAYLGGAGGDVIINTGIISGTVQMGAGNDTYDGRGGLLSGDIEGGAGDDLFYLDQDVFVDGGGGADTVFARSDVRDTFRVEEITLLGSGDFTAMGDNFTVRLNGNGGNNQLLGGQAATITLAGAGNDVVEGFAGNDTMRGNGGDDALNGGADDDVIFGGTGDDTITGGRGRDILYGNQGADVFVYEDVLDSAASADRDIIVGFERGRDEIDVSAINDNAFSFVGTGGFSGGGGMELGYRVVAGGTQVVVEMDENGDGLVDAEIRVRGVGDLSADDFVL